MLAGARNCSAWPRLAPSIARQSGSFLANPGALTMPIDPTFHRAKKTLLKLLPESLSAIPCRDEMAELDEDLEAGGIVSRSKSLSSWNRVDRVIRDGIRQMRSVDPEHNALRVLWVHCVGHYDQVYADRLEATIYGIQKLVSSEIESLITCYYFHESTFFRRRDDQLLLTESLQKLLLNETVPPFHVTYRQHFQV
jgi:hypothetical protein